MTSSASSRSATRSPSRRKARTTPKGWEQDFEFWPRVSHAVWGDVHGEFCEAIEAIYAAVKPMTVGLDIAIQGHSRGAALADGLASRFALDGIKTTLTMFEAPRFGMQKYVNWARQQVKNGIIKVNDSTTNGPDPIILEPPSPWLPTHPTLELNNPPGGLEDIVITAWHMSDAVYPGYLKIYFRL